jgi:hypothetical protein
VKLRTDDELIPVASSLKIPLGSSVFLNWTFCCLNEASGYAVFLS